MGIPACCGINGDSDCGLSAHAATGWCLQNTGEPVLVVTTLACPNGQPATDITVTLIDPGTGESLLNQPVTPCGGSQWEVNQLCDYDPETGVLIATFTQIFEFDENTQTLNVTLVRADDPDVIYVPVGEVRDCADTSQFDVELRPFCYDDIGNVTLGVQAWIFLNGVYQSSLYFDEFGNALAAPVIVDCPELATESTLQNVLDALVQINANTDGLEACCATGNTLLEAIGGNTDGLEALLTTLISNVDGLEACCAATNVLLTAINGNVDGLEGELALANATLTSINGHVDQVETKLDSVTTALLTIDTHVDGLEACCAATNVLLTAIDGNTNGIESLLTTINGSVDGLEACCAAGNVILTAIDAHVDGLEGFMQTVAGTVYAEDSAHASGNPGTFVLAVRNDAEAVRTSTDGDYSPVSVDSAGRILAAEGKFEDAVHVSGDRGTPAWGVRNDNDAVCTSADGDYSPISVDSSGRLKTTSIVTATPATTGGENIYKNLDANATGQNIKSSAGQVYTMLATNRANSERFLKFYNKATAPVVGTDIPVFTVVLDGRTGGGQTGLQLHTSNGWGFTLGIGIAATTGIADSNTGNPGANDVVVAIGYK